jgi:hypothetical protein
VHKYENGVIPEPRRLVKLAQLGGTTVEWLLTGHHWENGSDQKERFPEEVYRIAQAAAELGRERLRTLSEALEMLERAARELADATGAAVDEMAPDQLASALQRLTPASRRALEAALALHQSVVETALDMEARRFEELSNGPSKPAKRRKRRG